MFSFKANFFGLILHLFRFINEFGKSNLTEFTKIQKSVRFVKTNYLVKFAFGHKRICKKWICPSLPVLDITGLPELGSTSYEILVWCVLLQCFSTSKKHYCAGTGTWHNKKTFNDFDFWVGNFIVWKYKYFYCLQVADLGLFKW